MNASAKRDIKRLMKNQAANVVMLTNASWPNILVAQIQCVITQTDTSNVLVKKALLAMLPLAVNVRSFLILFLP